MRWHKGDGRQWLWWGSGGALVRALVGHSRGAGRGDGDGRGVRGTVIVRGHMQDSVSGMAGLGSGGLWWGSGGLW